MYPYIKREGTYVYLWLIHVNVWQKPTQYGKAIILQVKINKLSFLKEQKKKKKRERSLDLDFLFIFCFSQMCFCDKFRYVLTKEMIWSSNFSSNTS